MSKKNSLLLLEDQFILREDQIVEEMDLKTIFPTPNPVEIEIGCGSGTLLVYLAKANPEHNFLGIEWANEFYRYTADRIRRWKLTHTRMLRTDARDFVMYKLKSESIQTFHIYFPDPWPKRRHHRRRLFIQEFCRALSRVLVPGGKVYAASDHQEYFEQIERNLLAVPRFKQDEFDSPAGNQVLSNFETKFVKEGRSIYRIAVKKV
jgi:tRNA (guanine-N7-)-methyltransferase